MLRYTYIACLVLTYKRIAEVPYPADMWTGCVFKTAVGAAAWQLRTVRWQGAVLSAAICRQSVFVWCGGEVGQAYAVVYLEMQFASSGAWHQ